MITRIVLTYIATLIAFLLPINTSSVHGDGNPSYFEPETVEAIAIDYKEYSTVQKIPVSNREIGEVEASKVGWTGQEWNCLERLWTNESNWRETVANYEGSGAYGIAQALPAHKMASHGQDYLTNPKTQIRWGLDYIKNRYKTPCGALNFWLSQSPHWY